MLLIMLITLQNIKIWTNWEYYQLINLGKKLNSLILISCRLCSRKQMKKRSVKIHPKILWESKNNKRSRCSSNSRWQRLLIIRGSSRGCPSIRVLFSIDQRLNILLRGIQLQKRITNLYLMEITIKWKE